MKALRILVVEDDAIIGMCLGEMLELMGHEVCGIAATEAEAVDHAARYEPDLIIIDAHLDQGSGVSAVRTINKRRETPHLFVSGDLSDIRAQMPASAMIHKPYNEDDLANGIERALRASAVH